MKIYFEIADCDISTQWEMADDILSFVKNTTDYCFEEICCYGDL